MGSNPIGGTRNARLLATPSKRYAHNGENMGSTPMTGAGWLKSQGQQVQQKGFANG